MRFAILICACLIAASNVVTAQQLQPPNPSSRTTYVILKSGSVFLGTLDVEDGRFVVRNPNGSAVQLDRSEVELLANSFFDAYSKLKSRLKPFDVNGHQALAKWCLKYRDVESAAKQIDYLSSISSDTAMLSTLHRRLESLTKTKRQTSDLEAGESAVRTKQQNALQTTSDSDRQIEKLITSLTRDALSKFTTDIQPRLIHGCAASNCHASSGISMRLWPSGMRGGLVTTAGRKNLYAAVKQINLTDPNASPILVLAKTPHGGTDAPIYNQDSQHFQAIRDWAISVSKQQYVDGQDVNDAGSSVQPATFVQQEIENHGGILKPILDQSPTNNELPKPADLVHPVPPFVPLDEFDPEIFNRMQAEKRRTRTRQATDDDKQRLMPINKPKRIRSLPPLEPPDSGSNG